MVYYVSMMGNFTKKQRITQIFEVLEKTYPYAKCELNYENEFQLLVAVILSAQCTDKRVNEVTKKLFEVASTPYEFATIEQKTLESLIFSCGFYHNKAKSIISASKAICEKHAGKVPDDFDELVDLPGVGRKTANVMCAEAFKQQAIAVDTHVFRTSNRLKIATGKTPYEVEKGLRLALEESQYSRAHHLLIFHGRYTCKSQRPQCKNCALAHLCDYEDKK